MLRKLLNLLFDMNYFGLDQSWTLFLDRDGVINERLNGDYVKNWEEFSFKSGAIKAIVGVEHIFSKIFIVTNQRGVGLGIMTEGELNEIHNKMIDEVVRVSGRIDKIYSCTSIDSYSECRKPNIGMGLKAKKDFPEIVFSKSIIVGDSISDMEFGEKLGMKRVFISSDFGVEFNTSQFDYRFNSLYEFAEACNTDFFN
jgi:D-glycero-D-manno-heptose 1,7-bisphosphate phosphatase